MLVMAWLLLESVDFFLRYTNAPIATRPNTNNDAPTDTPMIIAVLSVVVVVHVVAAAASTVVPAVTAAATTAPLAASALTKA